MDRKSIQLKFLLLGVLITFVFTACSKAEIISLPLVDSYDKTDITEEKKNLKLGVTAGPYGEMFNDAILPILVKKGYTVEQVIYNDYIEPNFALSNNEIDLNIFQHYIYFNNFKFEHNMSLSAIAEIPTASMGIFSKKYLTIEDVPNGATICLPNDVTNFSRALRVLESTRLVTLDISANKLKATIENIEKNPKNLKLYTQEPQTLVAALDDFDLAVINGNFAIAGGLKLSNALSNEVLDEGYINIVAVRTEDLNKQFANDIIDAIQSDEFKNVIKDKNGKYFQFQRPPSF